VAVVDWEYREPNIVQSLRCTHCGHARDEAKPLGFRIRTRKEWIRYGDVARDPVFHLKLWLQASYRREVLWAYNWEHLASLEDLVRADLRPGNSPGYRNVESQVPKWILLAKNRQGLLRVLRQLRAKKS
jgi:hypothetical protein